MQRTLPIDGKYCAYLRKSRADRDSELKGEDVLARHRSLLEELAVKLHITISQWYCEVVSGDTIDSRPEMQRLLSDVDDGFWNGCLVVEVERLARGNTKDQGIVAESFKYSNTLIITPVKTYDPEDEFDEEYFEFGLFMSRREYKTINRRLQRGRIASVMEGKFIGSTAPFGWIKVKIPNGKGYTLEPDPATSPILYDIYTWSAYGILQPDGSVLKMGHDMIAKRLDSLGVKPAVGAKWSKSTVADILANEINAGYITWGKYKYIKVSTNGIVTSKRVKNPDYIKVKGLHPPLIPEDLFEAANKSRKEHEWNAVPYNLTLQNPLSGLVYCKKCGQMMTRLGPNTRNKYSTLKCPNRYCHNVSSPLFLIEKKILDFLRSWLETYEVSGGNIPFIIPIQAEIDSKYATVKQVKNEIAGLHKQLNNAYDFLEQGIYTLDVFRERQKILQNNTKELEDSLLNIQKEIAGLEAFRTERELFVPKVKHLLDTYDANTAEMNNQILKEIIDKITYIKDSPNGKGQLSRANFILEIYPKLPS